MRRQLLLPYVLLVIFVSVAIGWVSYRAGKDAVDNLSSRILGDAVSRISADTEEHLARALVALHSIAPDPATLPQPQEFSNDLDQLESRIWVASGLFMDVNNYVYFGGADGRFIGVNRVSSDLVELYRRDPGAPRRSVHVTNRPGDRARLLRHDDYDPRKRPWYGIAAQQDKPVWSPVYNDFSSREPTITLAQAVRRADRSLVGVVATDVTLKLLTDFLRTLRVSDNGIAFVIDGNGYMIATSGQELPFRMVDGQPKRMHVSEMRTALISRAWFGIQDWKRRDAGTREPVTLAAGQARIAAGELGGRYGVDWLTVVAVPQSDFTAGVQRSLMQGVLIAVLCILAAIAIGMSLISRVLGDIRKLTDAARRIGEGQPLPHLNLRRRDELGQLALSFSEMEHNLRIDKLTAVFNRASLIAQIGFLRRQLDQKAGERPHFALLFIDLDHFKTVNDQYGHAAGDRVLATVAARLKESVRVTDVVARYGGDEFVILLKGLTEPADVTAMEEKIRNVVEAPVPLEHGTARVGVSIGWAMFPDDGDDIDALLKIADKRMFDAKKLRKAARAQTSST
ncbi:hypothetical protein NCCP691_15080 [Noviherbaspirillum aridicola]|uniref:Diguanylate cyclase (GGDEF)-like protein n=1 Tax=Noviherbaspirillum aridicola TaxID=2849687 RepID=A0ABQ4Q2X6_9BURK|nr:hypothetical protein NCCP691_15080 [Noviherbaspirillum aridicola]